jgi:hypothetical protein
MGSAMNSHPIADFVETGQGPLVVLVHSSVAGARQWRRLMTDLDQRADISCDGPHVRYGPILLKKSEVDR